MKEYEKLLQAEDARKNYQKAVTMVKLGLFNQGEETEFDFSNLELLNLPKKYKGIYDLYENQSTGDLTFVCPLVENNVDDNEYEKTLKPYAFDVIRIENVTDAEYAEIIKASVHERTGFLSFALVFFYITLILATITVLAFYSYVVYAILTGATTIGGSVSTLALVTSIYAASAGMLFVVLVLLRNFKSK